MDSPTILERLARGELIISDGATGSFLQAQGLGDGDPEEWNVSHPEVVQGMAKAYFDAGSQMVLTNTSAVRDCGRVTTASRIGRRSSTGWLPSTRAARRRRGCFVVGSVGPTGEVLNDPLRENPLTEERPMTPSPSKLSRSRKAAWMRLTSRR